MKDSEFYTAPEGWPQPPDEDQTLLEGSVTASAAKPKKKAAGRVRKKLSESLAGVTAAAVAVVMVANSIPSLKDSFGDLMDIVGEICPMCGVEGCPYYDEGREGLTLSYDAKPEYLKYDSYKMNGFVDRDQGTWQYCEAIITADSQRLLLHTDDAFAQGVDGHSYTSWFTVNTEAPAVERYAVTGLRTIWRDGDTREYIGSVYAYLIYSADGDFTTYDVGKEVYEDDVEMEWLDERSFPVDGIPNARIFVYSDLGDEYMDKVIDYCHVEQIDGPGVRYALGSTMYFQETEDHYRIYHDFYHASSSTRYSFYENGQEVDHYFWSDFCVKEYRFSQDFRIEFAADSWVKIFEKYAQLNEDAPKYGHEVYFPITYVGEATVNDITYLCYAGYMDDTPDEPDRQWATFLLVPKQEPNIVFVESHYATPEELTALITGDLPAEYIMEQCYAGLSQVSRR